jgi:hypothetical protein
MSSKLSILPYPCKFDLGTRYVFVMDFAVSEPWIASGLTQTIEKEFGDYLGCRNVPENNLRLRVVSRPTPWHLMATPSYFLPITDLNNVGAFTSKENHFMAVYGKRLPCQHQLDRIGTFVNANRKFFADFLRCPFILPNPTPKLFAFPATPASLNFTIIKIYLAFSKMLETFAHQNPDIARCTVAEFLGFIAKNKDSCMELYRFAKMYVTKNAHSICSWQPAQKDEMDWQDVR